MLAQAKQTKRRRSFQSSLTCHTKSVKISSRYNGCCGSLGQTAGFAVADVVSGRKLIYIVHTSVRLQTFSNPQEFETARRPRNAEPIRTASRFIYGKRTREEEEEI